ncbi:putative ATP-dependent RNA helicase [uncultured archaeon]|nr:putative ATP-dependent RNA helicase [uncultured archaeon]
MSKANANSVSLLLKRYFGHESFIPPQREIIEDVLEKRDVFALLPTGGGKSLCYQLPALMQDGITLVVSPLIALMKDQVDHLLERGISAAYINSTLSPVEIQKIVSDLLDDKIKILYVAPERLTIPDFLSFLGRLRICLIAIDEAHCISEWGHEFRPAYRQLKMLKGYFPRVPFIALTATAVPEVQKDIIALLGIKNPSIHRASFNRKNLIYHIRPKNDAFAQLLDFLKHHGSQSGIIYCSTQKGTESIASKLRATGIRAQAYHAGLEPLLRAKTQERFIKGEVDTVVATIAFGMGIDKPDIRFVIHYDLPKNMETYAQETGRAGRDGQRSDCILFFGYGDTRKIEYLIEQGSDEEQKSIAYRKLQDLVGFCDSRVCRRKALLAYFGEGYDEENCGACDNCLEPRERMEGSIVARKILSCVSQVQERFGASYVIDILRGSRSRKILQNGHDSLKAHGTGREYSASQWASFIRELTGQGLLKIEGEKYPVLKLTNRSYDLLFGGEDIFLTKPTSGRSGDAAQCSSEGSAKAGCTHDFGPDLFDRLRSLRRRLADEEGIPQYMVFHNSSLKAMAAAKPRSLLEFRTIEGVGDRKLEKYGEHFIKEIDDYCRKCEQAKVKSEDLLHSSQNSVLAGEECGVDDNFAGKIEDLAGDSIDAVNSSILERLDRLDQQVNALHIEIEKLKKIVATNCRN